MKIFSITRMNRVSAVILLCWFAGILASCGQSAPGNATSSETVLPKENTESTPATDANSGQKLLSTKEIYLNADRGQLIEKAKQEGAVNLYTSMNLEDANPIIEKFQEKYGIKVVVWRATSENVVQRALTEARAQRYDVDLFETDGKDLEILYRENILEEFDSPYFADLNPEAIPEHKHWAADRFNFFVSAYNTNAVKADEFPKTYEDFLDPKWNGKVGIEAGDTVWLANLVKYWGEEKGTDYFEKLSENKPIIRKGHTLLTELVASGEVPLTLTVYNHKSEQLKQDGAPIEWVPLEPTIGVPLGVGLAKHAPHPHAALLLADFMLSPEGQNLVKEQGRVPSSTKVDSNLNKFIYKMADPKIVLDEWDKWDTMWNDLFLK